MVAEKDSTAAAISRKERIVGLPDWYWLMFRP